MRMLCYKCSHSWNYKGKNTEGKGYITCSGCYYKIRVDKAMVEETFKQEILTKLPKKELLPIKLPTKLLSFKERIPTTHIKPIEVIKEKIAPIPSPYIKAPKENPMKIRIIKSDIVVRVIPPKSPLQILEHQRSYGFMHF